MNDLKFLAAAPFAEIDRLWFELDRSRACEAALHIAAQRFVDGLTDGYRARNELNDALDFCSNYDTRCKFPNKPS
jgi:hypothetical protein